MREQVKLALRIKTDAFNGEIEDLIDDCLSEMKSLGVYHEDRHIHEGEYDSQIQSAVIFYCKWKFGNNPDAERWEKIYLDKMTKLMCMSGYGLPPTEQQEG